MKYLPIITIILLALIGFAVNARAATILFPTGGGTGWGNLEQYSVLLGNGTGKIATTSPSTSGYVLTSNGASSFPTFQAIPASGGGSGNVATSSAETSTYIPFWTSTAGTPATLSGGTSNFTWDGTKLFASQASTTQLSVSGNTYFPSGIWDSSGNVGIGTVSPGARLDVQVAGDGTAARIGNTAGRYLSIGAQTTPVGAWLGYGDDQDITILSAGNVGIGTTSPYAKLSIVGTGGTTRDLVVNGRIQTGDANNQGGIWFGQTNQAQFIGQQSATTLGFYTNSDWRMAIDSSGNVGIGTTSPLAKLNVQNSSDASSAFLVSGSSKGVRIGTVADSGLIEGVDYSGFGSYQPLTIGGSDVRFTTSGTERLRVTGAGNVGIGTVSPDGKLHISGTTAAPAKLVFERSDGGSGAKDWVQYINAQHNFLIGEADDSGTLTSQYFTVADGGNVGIGTTSPEKLVHLYQTGTVATSLKIEASVSASDYTSANILLQSNETGANFRGLGTYYYNTGGSNEWYSGRPYSTSDMFVIGRQTGVTKATSGGSSAQLANALFVINSSGNVGIGTTSPAQALSVQGNGLISGNLTLANLTATGTIQAATLTLTNALGGQYGGTGSTTLSGILAGNGTSGVKTAVIGSGLSWDGTTLAVSGGSTASSTLLSDTNTWTGPNTYGSGLLRSTSPRITTSIFDANGATILGLTPVASATNYVTLTNSNGGTPGLSTNSGTVPLSLTGGGGVLTLTGDGTGTNGLTLNMAGGSAPVLSPTQSNTSLEINSNGSGSLLLNKSSGKVGVGTTSPAAILSVGAPAGTAPLMIGSTTKTLAQIDTNGKLQVLDTGTSYNGVVSSLRQLGFQTATTTAWTGSTTGPYINKMVIPFAGTIRQAICDTDTGTLGVDLYHTSTHLAYLNASTTKGTFKFTSNNTVTAGETLYMVAGTPASSPTSLTCTIGITETP